MALFTLRWLELEHPAGGSVYACALVAAVTLLIGAIAARMILAFARGKLLPPLRRRSATPSSRCGA
jgi:tellurite resistance protein